MGLILPLYGRALMDQLAAINVFVAIAEVGSLSAAGRRLGMPLTTVSRHLSALEDHVGVRLITRTTRDLVLTEAGRHYLDSCRRILAELEAVERLVAGEQGEPQGELSRLSCSADCMCCRSRRSSSGHSLASRYAYCWSIAWSNCSRRDLISRCASASPRLVADRDASRYDPVRDLRKPWLSCRAGSAIVAARACRP